MSFGGASIPIELFKTIQQILPAGKTILELGSGDGTDELLKYWNVISIEDNSKYYIKRTGNYSHYYIEAPIKRYRLTDKYSYQWYNLDIVTNSLKKINYDLILVDGPNGIYGRRGFSINYKLFNENVPIVIDDLHAKKYLNLAYGISADYNKKFEHFPAFSRKTSFGVLT